MMAGSVDASDTRRGRDRSAGILIAAFLLSLPLVNPYLRGDGNGYFAYVRSIVIDRDLDFANEFDRADPMFRDLYFDEDGRIRPSMRTATGRVANQWAVGASLLWLPFFLAAHGLVFAARLGGAAIPADGFSPPYLWLCAAGTACYGWLAIVMAWSVARREAGPWPARLSALAIWWASSLPVYMYFLPFHVHALAAFSVALFLWCWLRRRALGDSRAGWFAWGLCGGMMTAVYHLHALVLLVAAWELAGSARGPGGVARAFRRAAVFACGGLLALLPQLGVKWTVYGSPWVTGYLDEFFWRSPRLLQVAISSEHGLFAWTPVVLVATIGFVVWAWRNPSSGGPLALALGGFSYVVASYQNWHGQSSFGNRFFVSWTFLWVLGLATAVRVASGRRPVGGGRARAGWAWLVGLLAAWNLGLMFQWGTDIVPNRGPVDFAVVARNQLTVVPGRIGAFVWRYFTDRQGVTEDVERADRLERERYDLKR